MTRPQARREFDRREVLKILLVGMAMARGARPRGADFLSDEFIMLQREVTNEIDA